MNSAPAVLRMPAMTIEEFSPAEMQMEPNESYPWAAHTPEASPRCWEMAPNPDYLNAPVIPDHLMRTVCAPYFDQMCSSITMQQMSAKTMASQSELRTMCAPFFEQMVGALQHTLQDPSSTSAVPQGFQPIYYPITPYGRADDESTEADDTSAFNSLFSSPVSEDSDTTSDVERSIMVCRHWKSKGFCRLESKCKFLHPAHKCGIGAPATGGRLDTTGTEGAMPPTDSAGRRKRGGKNRSTRGHDPLSNGQEVA